MSAECNLAGIYNLSTSDRWYYNLPWEPVPIHTRPLEDDAVVALEAPCAKYDKLYAEIIISKPFTDLATENDVMFKFLSEKTGWDIQDIDYIRGLYSVFYIYSNYNSSYIPAWAGQVNRTKFTELAGLAWARETYTADLKRLKAGRFFESLFYYFDEVIAGKAVPKFGMVASSIKALSAVLNTMDLFDLHPIEFAATVIWELTTSSNGDNFVKMYYKKDYLPELQPLKLNGCNDYSCDYKTVKKLLSPFIIDKDTWIKECSS